MNCPFCQKTVRGLTGFQELRNFQRHLGRCRRNPRNLPITDGRRTVITPAQHTLADALEIRAASGQ